VQLADSTLELAVLGDGHAAANDDHEQQQPDRSQRRAHGDPQMCGAKRLPDRVHHRPDPHPCSASAGQ
jgi:hypothetical protein